MAASGCLFFGTIHFTWIAHVAGCLDTANCTRIWTGISMCRYLKAKEIFVFFYVLLNTTLSVLLGTISLSFGLMFSPVAVSLCKRKSTRLIAVIGGLVTALGCLFTSFALQLHQMIFSFGKFFFLQDC